MRFDIHFRDDLKNKIIDVVNGIKDWNQDNSTSADEIKRMEEFVYSFNHCNEPDRTYFIGGADGSGDFPCVTYGDSFVYLVTALTRLYKASKERKLVEQDIKSCDLVEFLWLPEDEKQSDLEFEEFFTKMVGMPLIEFCRKSDYLELRNKIGRFKCTPEELVERLIKPAAHDASNVRIQIMSVAELCAIIKLLNTDFFNTITAPLYLLTDGTLSLPLLRDKNCLFFEVVKRYCCKLAREKNAAFFAISKSNDLPQMEKLEEMIKKKVGNEHWYMRIPMEEVDGFKPKFLGTRSIPPFGAITYIFRLHTTTPPMRLDMDMEYWNKNIWNDDKSIMLQNEKQVFRDLDFASHDQRSYGYPYPIKACHDIASLTKAEKEALKKQIIDAAEKAGLKRKNFVDPSMLTGHK